MSVAKKISVTVGEEELRWLKRYAKRQHDGNLSSTLTEAARLLRQRVAQEAVLARLGKAARVSVAEIEALRREWQG